MGYKDLPAVKQAQDLLLKEFEKVSRKSDQLWYDLDQLPPPVEVHWLVRGLERVWNAFLSLFIDADDMLAKSPEKQLKAFQQTLTQIQDAVKALNENESNGLELFVAAFRSNVKPDFLFNTAESILIDDLNAYLLRLLRQHKSGVSADSAIMDSLTEPFSSGEAEIHQDRMHLDDTPSRFADR